MQATTIRLKKRQEARIRLGHPWIFSNEIDTAQTPLKHFLPGDEAIVEAHDKTLLGRCYLNPNTLIAGRIFSRNPHQALDQNYLSSAIKQSLDLRQNLFREPYYRLVFSEGDYIPGLIIDRYNTDFVVQMNTAGIANKKDMLRNALTSIFPDLNSVLLRNDSPSRLREGLNNHIEPLFGKPPEVVNLIENDVHFQIPIWQGQKTGWFYDHRENRARLIRLTQNKTVLDVFSYLGAFGLQALRHGAKHLTCIEASTFACEYILRNAQTNQVDSRVTILTNDAFLALRDLHRENRRYDVVMVDPPAFVKKRKDRANGLIAYQRINEMALKLLDVGGILVTSSCSMLVTLEDLLTILERAAFRARKTLQIFALGSQASDHPRLLQLPENDYLKTIFVRVIA